jgi:hypothetical protein
MAQEGYFQWFMLLSGCSDIYPKHLARKINPQKFVSIFVSSGLSYLMIHKFNSCENN